MISSADYVEVMLAATVHMLTGVSYPENSSHVN